MTGLFSTSVTSMEALRQAAASPTAPAPAPMSARRPVAVAGRVAASSSASRPER